MNGGGGLPRQSLWAPCWLGMSTATCSGVAATIRKLITSPIRAQFMHPHLLFSELFTER